MARTLMSRRGEPVRSSTAGFSLLELIIVLILLGLASAIVAPSFTGGFSGLELETSTRDLITLMRHARSQAIARQQVFRVVVGEDDPLSLKYFLTNDFGEPLKERSLPKGFRFQVPEDEHLPLTVSFYPNGRSSGAVLGIKNRQGKTSSIAVDLVTGFAKLQKEAKTER